MPAAEQENESVTYACDFRTSGLLSNDSTRQLRSLHESFARSFAHALDLFLGSPLEVKLLKVEQQGVREFAASLLPGSYLVPLALQPLGERVVARFDSALFFPLLDILLGGSGEQSDEPRELTEIDEELFRSMTELMCTQLERAWKAVNVSVAPQASIKSLANSQLFAMEDRVVVLQFEIKVSGTTSTFAIALPGQFAGAVIRGSQPDDHQLASQADAQERLRQRMLNCTMSVSATLPDLRVPLGELVTMQVGSLVNLRATAQVPVHLQVGQHSILDVTPVRRGNNKAAQVNGPKQMQY